MATSKNTRGPAADEDVLLQLAAEELAQVQARIGVHFRRAEARHRAHRFLQGLLAAVERKNGWQLAEELGEHGPRGIQRLLGEADWDEDVVRDELRAYVLEHLAEENAVLVVDETGFLKKGKKSAGVARQYSGTAGRRENCQVGVFLLYASARGAAFLDRALYLPEEWTQDRVRSREAGIPDEVAFATKGVLAQQMLQRAFVAGVPAKWVVGDTVYGHEELRVFLEDQHHPYVVAVPGTHAVWSAGQQQPVALLSALLPAAAWVVLSAGEGSQGPRLYEWAWLQLPPSPQGPPGQARWVLIRRSLTDPSKRAYYRVAGSAATTLAELVQVAGSRWRIEAGFEEAKGAVGLDQYEVRGFRAWYRFVTLALWAHAVLVALRARGAAPAHPAPEKKSGAHPPEPRLSVADVLRLLHALWEPVELRARRLCWFHFRRAHQAQAQCCHRARRAAQAPQSSSRHLRPIQFIGLPALTEDGWEQLRLLLPPQKPRTGRPAVDHRLVVEGMLWVARTGSSWRELPRRYGPWTTVASRYQRWCKEGLWTRIVQTLLAADLALPSASSA